MPIIVQKYGGSSVADLDRLRGVARRIAATRQEGSDVVVVVSAMGNTTNELLGLARTLSANPNRRELDMLASTGERIAMALLAIALQEIGVPARSLTGSQAGIVTDEAHGDARVVEVRTDRIRSVLSSGEVAIVAGFQGVSREREVTTLGRGGSDTTAVVLAAALQAAWCEICSDVDGVWSADPRVVLDAHPLPEVGLDAALGLARGGAKVLLEDAVRLARDLGVELHASATFGPGSGTRLTTAAVGARGASGVTGDDQIVRARIGSNQRAEAVLRLRDSGARLRRRVGEVFYLDIRNAHGVDLRGVHRSITIEGPTALVTAAGSGLGQRLDDIEAGTDALLEGGVWVTAQGAEGDVAWWEVAPRQLADAVRLVHGALCSSTEAPR